MNFRKMSNTALANRIAQLKSRVEDRSLSDEAWEAETALLEEARAEAERRRGAEATKELKHLLGFDI